MPSIDRNAYPVRFNVIEKVCLKCGSKYYASRNTAKYCSNTCRAHANFEKHAQGALIPKKKDNAPSALKSDHNPSKPTGQVPDKTHTAFIAANTDGLKIAERDWQHYFPDIPFDDVWEGKINQGYSDKYSFEYVNESKATVYKPHGWHIYLRLL